MIKYPDYDNSLLSLISSVLAYYGCDVNHKTLSDVDLILEKNYKNVVVMLFDGMGTAVLDKHLEHFDCFDCFKNLGKDSFFRKNQRGVISSVFPPTTTAATVTMETGLSPIEHGWLGWSLYFSEIGTNVSIFPNTISGSDGVSAADYHVARRYIPYKSVYEKIEEATNGKVRACSVSPFSEYQSKSLEEICDTVVSLCNQDGKKYIYTYWHQPDYDMHDLGTSHEKIAEHLKNFNIQVEKMCSLLSDTLVIITADHGLIDTKWLFLSDFPELTECFERMPSIEPRAMTFFIKNGMHKKFESEFEKIFCKRNNYILMSRDEVLSSNLFGYGYPHSKSLDFIGDYLAVATGNVGIEYSGKNEDEIFKAAHAGLTCDEMNVPLIIYEC